jgi:hypothetical protein
MEQKECRDEKVKVALHTEPLDLTEMCLAIGVNI